MGDFEEMAMLDLPSDERAWVSEQAERLLAGFDALEGADTSEIQPLVTVLDVRNVLREDISAQLIPREELLSNAPEQYDGYFQVPKTLV